MSSGLQKVGTHPYPSCTAIPPTPGIVYYLPILVRGFSGVNIANIANTWIFETAQIIAFSGKNAVTASFSKDGVFCCDEAHAGRKQKETASLSVQTASLGVQTASFPVHGFCTTHKPALFFDYGVFSLKNASGKNLCRLKIQVCIAGTMTKLKFQLIYVQTEAIFKKKNTI